MMPTWISFRRHGNDIHVGFIVGLEGAYVAPIEGFFLIFVDEVVGEDAIVIHHLGENVFAEIVTGIGIFGIFQQDRDEDVSIEKIDAHGAGGFFRIQVRTERRGSGLLFEAVDAAVLIDIDHAEAGGLREINLDGSQGDIGGGVFVLPHHLAVIHFIDVIAAKDEDVLGLLGADGVNVLVHRVGGALIPLVADALLGRKDFHELANLAAENVPAFTDVAIERERLVLGEDVDAAQIGVETVGKSDINDAIHSAEGDGGLGAVAGERVQALSSAAGKKDSESVFHRTVTDFRTD